MKELIKHRSFVLQERHKEKFSLPSKTVPNETLSIRQIMEKHVKGMRIADTLARQPAYDSGADFDSHDLEKLKHLDLHERSLIVDELRVQSALQKKKIEDDQKAAAAREKEKTDLEEEIRNDFKEKKKKSVLRQAPAEDKVEGGRNDQANGA